jgi:hypothetical protein
MKRGFHNKLGNISLITGGSIVLAMFLLLSFCCLFSPAALADEVAKPEQIILSWTSDPLTSQTITWLGADDSLGQLQYQTKSSFNGSFDSAQQVEAEANKFDSRYYRYSINIRHLTPDTDYIYRLGKEGCWTEPYSFSTADDTDRFSFLYMGDVQSGYLGWGRMLNALYQENPRLRFSLLGGDLTNNDADEMEWGEFLDAASGVFSRIPLMPTLGNHDGTMYKNFFALPDNGPAGLEQEFYSFDYGNAHFVVLNSNNNCNEKAKQWLHTDLQNSKQTWKFALFHHPAYPASPDYKGIDQSIIANWVPILEQNRVDMVFVGHQHQYMRTHPIFQGEIQSDLGRYGIIYVMGNAGAKTYIPGQGFPYIAREESGSNYQVIDIEGKSLTLRAKRADGGLIESYTINKTLKPAPILVPDVAGKIAGQLVELNFIDDADWRLAINEIKLDGVKLSPGQYSLVLPGKITIAGDLFSSAKEYNIEIKATGYQDAAATQNILASVTLNSPHDGQEFKQGQQITVKGKVNAPWNSVRIQVKNPRGESIYGPLELQVTAGQFESSFTLNAKAEVGSYNIILEGGGLPATILGKFKVIAGDAAKPVGEVILTISGSGVRNELKLTQDDLLAKNKSREVFSAINTWPSKKWYVGEGPLLKDLLNEAGLRDTAGMIRFSSVDGYSILLTTRELIHEQRYIFPQFMDGDSGQGHIRGSANGARAVEAIIALRSAEGTDNPAYMSEVDSLLLMLGQRAVHEQNAQLFVKKINKIEVINTSPSKWDNPQADPSSKEVSLGTRVRLSSAVMDDDKIYYTTDGSSPTIDSLMYNPIASRWQSSRADIFDTINHPIEITRDTTIKAITIGPGKMDSDVVTFSYKLKKTDIETIGKVIPSNGGEVILGTEASIKIPAYALKESGAVEVKIERVINPPPVPAGLKLLGGVYEFSVGGQNSYSFAKKVLVKLGFDSSELESKESPAMYYYDESKSQWQKVGGTVSANFIELEVDHFTKFAVMAADKGKKEEQKKQDIVIPMVKLSDIQGHWAQKDIEKLVAAGAIAGYPDGSFQPDKTISRAEFTTVLVKTLKLQNKGSEAFADTESHWAKDYIAIAAAYGLISGYNAASFGPDDPITREQMAVIISRISELNSGFALIPFSDQARISAWARAAVAIMAEKEIMKGYQDNTFRPQDFATRAEAVTVIVKGGGVNASH